MFTDLVGYTSLTQRDEGLAMELLADQRGVVRSVLPRHGGKEVKTMGDAFLVEFGSALAALKCAVDIQQSVHEMNSSRPPERKVLLRVGVHLGDVIQTEDDVYGDAVNVASRVEPLAPPGGVCITEQVNDQVKNKSAFRLVSLGKKELKNVAEPVEVFQVVLPWENSTEEDAAALDRKRVAVLPFANLSSDPEEGYFADGMTEELITSLSGVRQLTVIARTSVMKYKGSTKGASEVGKELSVGTLLEGSVRKAGSRVRITAQLIDTSTEGHLWARNYDRQLEDVFAIQSEIAEMVAEELRIRLVDNERRAIEKKPTENTEAYTYYLRGRELVRERTEESLRKGVGLFEKAVSLDPSFAKAYAGMAECLSQLVNESFEPHEQAMPRAELAVEKALRLDPDLAEAHSMLSWVLFQEDEVRRSEAEARRAVELNPSAADAYFVLSNLTLERQDREEGIRYLEACYRLDPVRSLYAERLGAFYFYLGREAEAMRHWERTMEVAPAGAFRGLSEYYLTKGDISRAREYQNKVAQLEPTGRWATWMGGFLAAREGDREGALKVIDEINRKWVGATSLNDIAFVYFALGDLDSYFAYLNRALDQHTLQFRYAIYCPLFSGARGDPRYQALMDKFGKMVEAS